MGDELKVFVSSTSEDLKDFRAAARLVILDLRWGPVMMEHFPAQAGYTLDVCRREIEECDVVLLIIAWRQGWVPGREHGGDGDSSVTALELRHAEEKGIPVLVLMANDSWPRKYCEREEAKDTWVQTFRSGIKHPTKFFSHEEPENKPAFSTLVKETLLYHKESLLRASSPTHLDSQAVDRAMSSLGKGSCTPVLGSGIYGRGPLSSHALAAALRGGLRPGGGQQENIPLATVAEYRERTEHRSKRIAFLQEFADIVHTQTDCMGDSVPPILNFVGGLGTLKTVIATTYDSLTDERLPGWTVVSHVLRIHSPQTRPNRQPGQPEEGKVMIERPGKPLEFCWPRDAFFDPGERVLYKPRGSIIPTEYGDSDLLDTAVITETDYALFLKNLASQSTGLPNGLPTRLRKAPLMFLGYTMDEWQYRIIKVLFQSLQILSQTLVAVRIPDGEVERAAWSGLDAQLIEMDPNEFARGPALTTGASAG